MNDELNNGYNPQNIQNNQKNEKIPEQGNFSASPNNEITTSNVPPTQNRLNSQGGLPPKEGLGQPDKGLNNPNNNAKNSANNGFNPNSNQVNRGNQIRNNQNLNRQNKINQAKQEVLKKGAKAAANAVAGPAAGAAVDALSKTKAGQKALDTASNALSPNKFSPFSFFGKKKKKNEDEEEATGEATVDIAKKVIGFGAAGTFGLSGCLTIIAVLMIIVIIISPLFYINELINSAGEALSDFGEKLGNFLTFRGWCNDEECQEVEQNNFYEHINEVYDEYLEDKNVRLNATLLTATLTYAEPFTTLDDEEITSIEDLAATNYIDFRKSDKKVEELATRMVSYCCYENGSEYAAPNGKHMCQISNHKDYDDIDYECPEDVYETINGEEVLVIDYSERYKLDIERYEEYLRDEFVRKFYYEGKENADVDSKVDNTVDEIFLRVAMYDDMSGQKGFTKVYAYCSGVTVLDSGGNMIGTYNLEEYVAGVVSGEAYPGQDMEAYKAQAVAARTYVLNRTNNCSEPIVSSQSAQVFEENIADYAREAAQATEGQVLLYNDKIFSSEYDSYCYNDSSCSYGTDSNGKYVVYTRLPNGETHKVYLSDEYFNMVNGGHGRGMSQVVSYEMADNGSTYDEILKYFYSPGVTISQMVTIMNGEYVSTSGIPMGVDEVRARSDYYEAMGTVSIGGVSIDLSWIYSKTQGLFGECVWYAKSRALEIIYNSTMDDLTKAKAYQAITNVYQNGEGWYRAAELDIFAKSTDYTKPAPGAIVSWSSSVANGASHNYGHVAIIESVDYENQTVVISDGWNVSNNNTLNWNNFRQDVRTVAFEDIPYYSNGYTFNGYVYLLGIGE